MNLTILIPAYNETMRLPPYLKAIKKYLSGTGRTYEIIIVDDGSTDGMKAFIEKMFQGWAECGILRHTPNQGRGVAIREGNIAARGDLVLYADADGATPIEEESKLRKAIEHGADIAIGSRIMRHKEVSRFRTFHRGIVSKVFASLVKLLVAVPVRDTQCGFKMWRRHVGDDILTLCEQKHWLLDVEFLAVAQRLGYKIAEVPVTWAEVAGSKVRLFRDSWAMFFGLWRIRHSLRRLERMMLRRDSQRQVDSDNSGKNPGYSISKQSARQ